MVAEKREAVRIGYPKHWFLMGTLLWAAATGVLAYLAASAPTEGTMYFWGLVAGAEGVLMFLFFVPPLFTSHWAGEKGLRLRMGLLVDATIPYAWIKGVKQTSVNWGGVRVGIGVRYSALSRTLFVTSDFHNLVAISLDEPHKLGKILKMSPDQVVISVGAPNMLMDLVRERAGVPEGE